MDELLAHMAEKKTVLRQKINESIGAVRAWLREHGFAQLAGYGNANPAHLLANVRKSLAAKAAGKASMPVWVRRPRRRGLDRKAHRVPDVGPRASRKPPGRPDSTDRYCAARRFSR